MRSCANLIQLFKVFALSKYFLINVKRCRHADLGLSRWTDSWDKLQVNEPPGEGLLRWRGIPLFKPPPPEISLVARARRHDLLLGSQTSVEDSLHDNTCDGRPPPMKSKAAALYSLKSFRALPFVHISIARL